MPYARRRKYYKRPTSRFATKSVKTAAIVAKKPVKRQTRNYKLTKPMRMLVDHRINRKLETKTLKYSLFPPTDGAGYNAYTLRAAITDLSVATIIPAISHIADPDNFQGNTPFRIGNVIHPKYCYLKVRLYVDQNDTTSGAGAGDRAAIQPYLFIGYNKTNRSYASLTADSWGGTVDRFFRSGAGHGTYPVVTNPGKDMALDCPFDGRRPVMMHGSYNSDILRAYHVRTPELTRDLGYYFGDPTTGYGGMAGKFLAQKEYTFKIPMPKALKYSNTGEIYPMNSAMPFLACGFTYMSGANPSNQAPLRIETSCTFAFTDA